MASHSGSGRSRPRTPKRCITAKPRALFRSVGFAGYGRADVCGRVGNEGEASFAGPMFQGVLEQGKSRVAAANTAGNPTNQAARLPAVADDFKGLQLFLDAFLGLDLFP